jgi:hypothetical protein
MMKQIGANIHLAVLGPVARTTIGDKIPPTKMVLTTAFIFIFICRHSISLNLILQESPGGVVVSIVPRASQENLRAARQVRRSATLNREASSV